MLVVGAGPAGSCAAAAAAREGVKTLLIDAKARIGEQPHCGEFTPKQLFTEHALDRSAVIQGVDKMETLVADLRGSEDRDPAGFIHTKTESPSPGFLIDRVRFDRDLAREAAAAGAHVLCSARLVRRDKDSWIIRQRTEESQVRPKVVIAADGAISTVAKLLGMNRPRALRGVQAEVPLARPMERTLVFLSRELVGGYAWLFPKGRVANCGLGVIHREDVNPRRLLDILLDRLTRLELIRPGILARTGGLIPVSGIRERLVYGNVILCGDAAGLTHPITGAGIPQAVYSGEQAGRAAAAAIRSRESHPLEAYEQEIRARYLGVMNHASAKRHAMMSRWNDPDFEKTCEQSWISFKGYRKRVRRHR